MAYMTQEHKAEIAAKLKAIIPAGWKYSLGVRHHSTLVLTIQSAPVDLIAEYERIINAQRERLGDPPRNHDDSAQINPYYLAEQFDESLPTMKAILDAMNTGNWDRSDSQTDYFDVGHYVSINIGRWDKPFVCTSMKAAA